MSELDKKVKEFSKPASTVKHSRKIAYVVLREDIVKLNETIEFKIKQNRNERQASWRISKDKIVK